MHDGRGAKLKVAWICEYPLARIAHRISDREFPASHPVPWITRQAAELATSGKVDLHVITISRLVTEDVHLEEGGIHFHVLKIPRLPRVASFYQVETRKIHACLETIQPGLVQGFGTESGYGYAAVTSRYPSVLMVQGIVRRILGASGWTTLISKPWRLAPLILESMTIRKCRWFLCKTEFAAQFVKSLNASAKIYLLPNPVRDEFFQVVRAPGVLPPSLVFVGFVIPEKGIEVLLRALADVARQCPTVRLDVLGSVDARYLRRHLEPLVGKLGIEQNVVFHGFADVEQVCRLLSSARALVLPTFMDTSPNVVSEALVASVPVIATRVGGIPEMITDRLTGRLVAADSPAALASAIMDVLNDPAEAEAMAARACVDARERHRPEGRAAALLNVYEELVGSRSEAASAKLDAGCSSAELVVRR